MMVRLFDGFYGIENISKKQKFAYHMLGVNLSLSLPLHTHTYSHTHLIRMHVHGHEYEQYLFASLRWQWWCKIMLKILLTETKTDDAEWSGVRWWDGDYNHEEICILIIIIIMISIIGIGIGWLLQYHYTTQLECLLAAQHTPLHSTSQQMKATGKSL